MEPSRSEPVQRESAGGGVFATCGQGDAVPGLRAVGADGIVGQVWQLWQDREPRRVALAAAVPAVVAAAREQLQCIVEAVRRGTVPEGI